MAVLKTGGRPACARALGAPGRLRARGPALCHRTRPHLPQRSPRPWPPSLLALIALDGQARPSRATRAACGGRGGGSAAGDALSGPLSRPDRGHRLPSRGRRPPRRAPLRPARGAARHEPGGSGRGAARGPGLRLGAALHPRIRVRPGPRTSARSPRPCAPRSASCVRSPPHISPRSLSLPARGLTPSPPPPPAGLYGGAPDAVEPLPGDAHPALRKCRRRLVTPARPPAGRGRHGPRAAQRGDDRHDHGSDLPGPRGLPLGPSRAVLSFREAVIIGISPYA
jgi:hypothetical protein